VPRVVIVGAGIAGLACAHRLAAAPGGCDVVVLEASDRAGGHLRTERIDEFLCEWGPNGFLDNAPDTLALVDTLGLRAEVVPSQDKARRRFVFRGGRLRLLPGSPAAFLTSDVLSFGAKLRIAREPFARQRPDGDETIHAFAARRLGREAADILVDPMVSGIFAGDARQLSLRAAFPKMWELEEQHGGLFRALLARRRKVRSSGAPVGSPLGRLTSFANGIETLPKALAARLGGRLRLGSPVSGLTRAAGAAAQWKVALETGENLTADHVVIAVPPPAASALLGPVDATLAATLATIPLAPLVVVALGFDRGALGHSLDGFGFLVPRGQGARILGALWESSVYPGRAASGHALIRVMTGGAHDPSVADLTDDQLLALVRGDLLTTMGITVEPGMVRIIRHRNAIPQYTVGHLDRLACIDAALKRLPGLHLTGHGYRGVGINAAIADAVSLAARLVAVRPDGA
jgi:oxygen-dependent protoporphyrinogen oxidase